jgi:predicted O-methyltransferase YrrM
MSAIVGRVGARLPPDATATNLAHRALLGASAVRFRDEDPSSRAISRAMATTARGRFTAAERNWIERIEARRESLARTAGEYGGPGRWAPACAWSVPRVWGRFMLRLVAELAPRSPIELGTGFGMSGSYQAAGLALTGTAKLTTLDREPTLIPLARESLTELGLGDRVEMVTGPIGDTLGPTAAALAPIDYALIDAEHTEAATVFNFDTLAPHLDDGAVVLVDDILSSEEMRRAWQTIRTRPAVRTALNLRRVGVVVVSGP